MQPAFLDPLLQSVKDDLMPALYKQLQATPNSEPYTLHPSPYTLHPTTYTLHPTPHNLRHTPTPCTLRPTPYTPSPSSRATAGSRLHPPSYSLTVRCRTLRERERAIFTLCDLMRDREQDRHGLTLSPHTAVACSRATMGSRSQRSAFSGSSEAATEGSSATRRSSRPASSATMGSSSRSTRTLVSLSLRLKDLLEPVTRVKKKSTRDPLLGLDISWQNVRS